MHTVELAEWVPKMVREREEGGKKGEKSVIMGGLD